MRFTTADGLQYNVDLKTRVAHFCDNHSGEESALNFHEVLRVYVDSPGAVFLDDHGIDILVTAPVLTVEDVPADCVSGEAGNVVFRTQNSAYEIDQEQRLIRRLSGTNQPTHNIHQDGEWQKYQQIIQVEVGKQAVIWYDDPNKNQTVTSTIREVTGTFISPPQEPVAG